MCLFANNFEQNIQLRLRDYIYNLIAVHIISFAKVFALLNP